MTIGTKQTALERGRELAGQIAPKMEPALAARYDEILPGMSESLVEWAYGRQLSRPGLDMKSRYIGIIAALTALGAQTTPQLKIQISGALKAGLTKHEIAETIWQTALYGGLPAAINALNTALDVFEDQKL
ncbi:MAG: carboxymuconolactone decarboxylase family protein [Pseudomonadota bacterium]